MSVTASGAPRSSDDNRSDRKAELTPLSRTSTGFNSAHRNGPAAVARWFSLGLSGVYLVAFASLWTQVPGLFGVDGVLPVGSGYFHTPWLLRQFRDPAVGLEWVCCAGTILGAMGVACARFRCGSCLAVLWWLYRTVYRAGGDFLGFQWDILLLECGLLGVLSQPVLPLPTPSVAVVTSAADAPPPSSSMVSVNARARCGLWVAQWLFFRLMFASGAVKLLWGDTDWWSLTALVAHFQSTCIPTPLSAVAHRLPLAWLKAITSLTYVIEMPAAFLCILPTFNLPTLATAKRVGCFLQVLFQVAIQMTGNYGFFNALSVTLCLPMLVDTMQAESRRSEDRVTPQSPHSHNRKEGNSTTTRPAGGAGLCLKPLSWTSWVQTVCPSPLTAGVVLGGTAMAAFYGFGFSLQQPRFSPLDFKRFTNVAACLSVAIALLSGLQPLWSCALAVVSQDFSAVQETLRIIAHSRHVDSKDVIYRLGSSIFSMTHTVAVTVCSGLLFGGSLPVFFEGLNVPFPSIGPARRVLERTASLLRRNDGVGSYGLFRSMTGVHGREELVIEAAIDRIAAAAGDCGAWFEIPFRFKPGDLGRRPPWNSPHQPRLDWQVSCTSWVLIPTAAAHITAAFIGVRVVGPSQL